jgi:hypothetical protein
VINKEKTIENAKECPNSRSADGEYTCRVENVHGSLEQLIHVEVHYTPECKTISLWRNSANNSREYCVTIFGRPFFVCTRMLNKWSFAANLKQKNSICRYQMGFSTIHLTEWIISASYNDFSF